MKRLPKTRAVRSALLAAGLLVGLVSTSAAQTGAVISARPGERTSEGRAGGGHRGDAPLARRGGRARGREQPGPERLGQRGRGVAVPPVLRRTGIFDPLAEAFVERAHDEEPATSQLVGADVSTRDTTDFGVQVTQLAPTGGTFTLGFAGNRTSTNSTFFFVNPSYFGGLTLSVQSAAPAELRAGRNDLADPHRPQQPRRLLPELRPERAGHRQRRRAGLLGPRLRAAEPRSSAGGARAVRGPESHHADQDRRRLARADRHRADRGRDRDSRAADHHRRGAHRGRAGPPEAPPEPRPREVGDVPIVPTDEVRAEQPAVSVEDGMRTALSRRPEIIAAAYNVDSDRIRYEYWRNQTQARCSTSTGATATRASGARRRSGTSRATSSRARPATSATPSSQVIDRDFKNWQIGLRFSYPILNRRGEGAARRRPLHVGGQQGRPDRSRAERARRGARRRARTSTRRRVPSPPPRSPASSPSATSTRSARSSRTE